MHILTFLFRMNDTKESSLQHLRSICASAFLFSSFDRNCFQSAGLRIFGPLTKNLSEQPLLILSCVFILFELYISVLKIKSLFFGIMQKIFSHICLKVAGRSVRQWNTAYPLIISRVSEGFGGCVTPAGG